MNFQVKNVAEFTYAELLVLYRATVYFVSVRPPDDEDLPVAVQLMRDLEAQLIVMRPTKKE
jgi:hypothetical protein